MSLRCREKEKFFKFFSSDAQIRRMIGNEIYCYVNGFLRFLPKLKHKNFYNEIEYDKLCPSGSAPGRIYGTPKMHKFSSSDSFPELRPIVSSIGTFD